MKTRLVKGLVILALIIGLIGLLGPVWAQEAAPAEAPAAVPAPAASVAPVTVPAAVPAAAPSGLGALGAKGALLVISALASALGIGIATLGTGLGQGNAVGKAMEAIGRNPEAQNKVFTTLLIGLAFIESLCLYALLIALALLFFNPLLKFVN